MGSRSLLAILSTRPFGGFFFGVIMLKKFYLALAILAGLLSPAHSAGTISFSLSQQLDSLGKPLVGCKLYLFQAGTSTPQIAYQDTALTLPVPGGSQLTCDNAGRLPQFFLADGLVKARLTDKNGVNQAYPNGAAALDNLLVIGPSSGGGGGGGTVDPTTIIATGDVKARYGTGVLTGFVRANGRTIGSATSGATERANPDAQPLFEYLWGTDPNLVVSTGRGASANADWVANKTIALPDGRNRGIAALGDMGNSDAGLFAGSTFASGNSTTLGSRLGVGTPRTILRTDLPNVAPTFAGIQGALSVSSIGIGQSTNGAVLTGSSPTIIGVQSAGTAGIATGLFTPQGTVQSLNGGVSQTTFDTVSPFLLVTVYIKL